MTTVVFVENDDSFSWNVIDRLPVPRAEVRIVPGAEAVASPGLLAGARAVVLGPGPRDPERTGLVALARRLADGPVPTLGICLGHQAIGLAFGARLVRVPPVHGRCSLATFGPSRFFAAFAGTRPVMRYHSLALADVAPPLQVVATTDDGLPMAIEHATLPLAGLQFHPDSHATPDGAAMLAAFFEALR